MVFVQINFVNLRNHYMTINLKIVALASAGVDLASAGVDIASACVGPTPDPA